MSVKPASFWTELAQGACKNFKNLMYLLVMLSIIPILFVSMQKHIQKLL